ncbi:hemolysin III family protein, partial [Lacticaseibacillus casei]
HHLGPVGFSLLVAGGLANTGGAMLYLQKGIQYIHVIWHLFVIIGSLCMYLSIYFYM